jgi:hypothetical protein
MNKSLSFYKPNSSNRGSAAQFQYGAKPLDYGLYLSIVKQFNWNNESKRGSFSENSKDPLKNKKIKLNATEASAICRVIDLKSDKWSTVHKSEYKTTSISFSHYIKDGIMLGYGMSINEKDGQSFMIGLNNDEGYLLKNFLDSYILFTFDKNSAKNIEVKEKSNF